MRNQTADELHQELCDHVLGHVFGLVPGEKATQPLFCQVVGWPRGTALCVTPMLYVYVRPVQHRVLAVRPLWCSVVEETVQPRPLEPSYELGPDGLLCMLKRIVKRELGLTRYELCYDQCLYEPCPQWLVPGHVFSLSAGRW